MRKGKPENGKLPDFERVLPWLEHGVTAHDDVGASPAGDLAAFGCHGPVEIGTVEQFTPLQVFVHCGSLISHPKVDVTVSVAHTSLQGTL